MIEKHQNFDKSVRSDSVERFILKKLLDWKNSPYRKPLILKGVRQVGKTWILKEFGKRYYENTAYFNFDENEEYRQFFETTKDVDRILQNLMLASGQKILPEKTLIIFDEVQDCPKVINSMKYFCENAPQYHIACAGSLLGIALAKPSSFPVGKVNFMQIDPMTFSEFLIANGDENLAAYLENVDTMRTYKPGKRGDTCMLGTRGYAAPEQFGSMGQTDARTDIYALGVTMHRLVTGVDPSGPLFDLEPIRSYDPRLPEGLEYIISKCTQRNPADRYQTCAQLLADLNQYTSLPKPKGFFSSLFGRK